jgi:hypothetical protein
MSVYFIKVAFLKLVETISVDLVKVRSWKDNSFASHGSHSVIVIEISLIPVSESINFVEIPFRVLLHVLCTNCVVEVVVE